MVWIETPTNPLLKLVDLKAIVELARTSGAIVVVDNTFATPYLQRPLELGCDIVMHSATKFINGHSDMVGGVVATSSELLLLLLLVLLVLLVLLALLLLLLLLLYLSAY